MINDSLEIFHPRKLSFGAGCAANIGKDLQSYRLKRILILTFPGMLSQLDEWMGLLKAGGAELAVDVSIKNEPTFNDVERLLDTAKDFKAECVIGVGGGSIMDVAKLLAAEINDTQSLADIVGINKLGGRNVLLICVPTTSGTGSEVSPNAILLDEADDQKKGIISPFLVPDMVYVDPLLTVSLPPAVTAATGLDALTHCIEAFANRFAHPLVDMYALEGIRLIGAHLVRSYNDGDDLEARAAMSLGSLWGGVCLGPVNTAAVHALSYPLGSRFHIAHGLSNALLLPHVIEFNLPAAAGRYAMVAKALGCPATGTEEALARDGIQWMIHAMKACAVPLRLSELKIPADALDEMAADAMKVTRLLKNNVREVSHRDAVRIYESAY